MITDDLTFTNMDVVIGDWWYRHWYFMFIGGVAKLAAGGIVRIEKPATVERTGPRTWTVTPDDGTLVWVVDDADGCNCNGQRVEPRPAQ